MGNLFDKEMTVSLESLPQYTNITYKVLRSNGDKEDGWVISRPPNLQSQPEWIDKHAIIDNFTWRIFMNNSHTTPELSACGWRRLDTIAPSHLTYPDAIAKWRQEFTDELNALQEKRALLLQEKHKQLEKAKEEEFRKSIVFVKNYRYDLFGYYSIVKTKSYYEFTFKKPIGRDPDWLKAIGQVTKIPLTETMGEGDFDGVTPDKIRL